MSRIFNLGLPVLLGAATFTLNVASDPLPPDLTYRPLPSLPFSAVKETDEAQKPAVTQRQRGLLESRYDLADRPMPGVMMSGGRKAVQEGSRVKLPAGETWSSLAAKTPQEIRDRGLLPQGFLPLPHVKQAAGGQVFPESEIREIGADEGRDLRRFDVDFDLPDHLTPEFPPPIFLTTHPELGDVSRGDLLTIRNFYEYMNGIITP
ncbi:cytochrome B6, partial [Mesorhizobium sp. M7A.F.Ca.US.006.01.1.1]